MPQHTIESEVRIISQTHKLRLFIGNERVIDILNSLKKIPEDAVLCDLEDEGGNVTLVFKGERSESITSGT